MDHTDLDRTRNPSCDDRISITEWPMDLSSEEKNKNQPYTEFANSSNFEAHKYVHVDQTQSETMCIALPHEQLSFKRKQQSTFLTVSTKHPTVFDGIRKDYVEPMAAVRVAKWWRKKRVDTNLGITYKNPNTKLYHISRMEACQEFLRGEQKILKRRLSVCSTAERASTHAALASIEDWLNNYDTALKNITLAVELCPTNSDFLWLKAKLSKQVKWFHIQKEMNEKYKQHFKVFPPVQKVDRISCKNLSVQEFKERFVKKGIPVILEDVVCRMTEESWDLDYIKDKAGCINVSVKHNVPGSVEWAKLEESRQMTVADHIIKIKEGQTEDYLFDWSLPLHCPHLANEIVIPDHFSDNFLTQTSPGSLYHDSWPSLFVAPAGVVSDLHVDAFASSFWMALFQGEKRWTFFDASDLASLYPQYVHSLDPVFSVNIVQPDLKSFPLLALTKPKQCVIKAGDLLFVPFGSPHFVENLTASVAVSSNYVDATNYHQVCEELRVNGLLDPRAKHLLDQLESSDFKARTMSTNN
ncbi:hypothetical protein EGW08_019436 [Elysia chlorotica]|uniref:JmjC domain-containing protein n=1 Tax=Elysia chlorotica TaxID=188477 RepID=A0A3S1BR13_ELYCH|nr:hypothetical protein EGW08_019436 [Elysia chlorotica]